MEQRRLIAYASLAIPLAFLGLPLYVYVPATYAQLPAIGLATTGFVLLAARLIDLFTDPAIGLLLDRWRQRLHPFHWLLIGTPLLALGSWWLFTPPSDATLWYLLLSVSLTYLGWTLVAIPYFAWGAELADTPIQHRKIAAWREAGSVVGAVTALLLTAWLAQSPLEVLRDSMLWLLLAAVVLLWWVPRPQHQRRPAGADLIDLWRHTSDAMRRLLGLHLLNATAASIPATLFVLYTADVLHLREQQAGMLLLLYFISAVLALPLWLNLAKRYSESTAWLIAIVVCALAFLPAAWLGEGDLFLFALICSITGATLGADIAIPAAMQAQLARAQSARLGMSREAQAFGLWGMASKLALAFAASISLPVLSLFEAGASREATLPWLYALLPSLIKLCVAALLWPQRDALQSQALQSPCKGNCDDPSDTPHAAATEFPARRL